MTMFALIGAALVVAFLGVAHSWLGERLVLGPLLAGRRPGWLEASPRARRTLRWAWHLTSVAWLGIGLVLAAFAFAPLGSADRTILAIVAATFLLTGIVICVSSRGRHFAWPLFVLVAGLALLPLWTTPRAAQNRTSSLPLTALS